MRTVMALATALMLASPGMADVLGNPYDGEETTVSLAQDFVFPGTQHLSTWVVSDFETTVDYYLNDVTSVGRTTHAGGADGEGANYVIYDGLPWDGGAIVLEASDGYEEFGSSDYMGADFGGQLLSAGNYYMAFQAVRDFLMTGGNSLVNRTANGNANDLEWNPGLGQNWGAEFRAVETEGGTPMDVNWTLNGTPVPEPTGAALLGLAALFMRGRR